MKKNIYVQLFFMKKKKKPQIESDTRETSIICGYFFFFPFCTIHIFTLSLMIKVDLMIKVEEASTLVKV